MNIALRRLVIAIIAIAVLVGGWFAYDANRAMRNSYALWWAADMVTEHLKSNDNRWPRSWDELRDDYDTCVTRSGSPWTFNEIRQRVAIDFTATTAALTEAALESDEPNFNVITAADGTDFHWQGRKPNTIIFNYLTGQPEKAPLRTGFGSDAG